MLACTARPCGAVTCDLNGDSAINTTDVQLAVNQALGKSGCSNDINADSRCNVLDAQLVTDGALGNACPPGATPPAQDSMKQIADDMLGLNEGHPHGVPSSWDLYKWAVSPTNNCSECEWNTPGSNIAYVLWGTAYIDSGGNPATNTRVNVRNCRSYWKRASTGAWTLGVNTSQPDDGGYAEDYSSEFAGTARTESDGTMSVKPVSGKQDHWAAPFPRIPFTKDGNQIGGVVAVCEMRLIKDNANGTDDRAIAKFVANVGADYYDSLNGPGGSNIPSIGGGKYKFVTTAWRSFAMTTLTESELKADPPPIDLTGINP